MPVRVSPTTLQQILRPALPLRGKGECRIDVDADTIRLRMRATDLTAYLDYSLPVPSPDAPITESPQQFWVSLEKVDDFLNRRINDDVVVTFPFETRDSDVILRSQGLTYRFPTMATKDCYDVSKPSAGDTETVVKLPHRYFNRAVRAADKIGDSLQLDVDPRAQRVEFRSPPTTRHSLTYPLSTDRIRTAEGPAKQLRVWIKRLREITPHISVTRLATLTIGSHLTYHVSAPVDDASLTLYIAELQNGLDF